MFGIVCKFVCLANYDFFFSSLACKHIWLLFFNCTDAYFQARNEFPRQIIGAKSRNATWTSNCELEANFD